MSEPKTFTGTTKAWTTSKWQKIDSILHTVKEGKFDDAAAAMTYFNHDMSNTDDWVEVGIATITVTFYPSDELVAKELEGLDIQLRQVRADNMMRENAILDRISKLQAITYTGELHD